MDWVGEWRGSDVAALFKAPSWVFSTHIRSVGWLSLRVSSCVYGVRAVGGGGSVGVVGVRQASKFCFVFIRDTVPCPSKGVLRL